MNGVLRDILCYWDGQSHVRNPLPQVHERGVQRDNKAFLWSLCKCWCVFKICLLQLPSPWYYGLKTIPLQKLLLLRLGNPTSWIWVYAVTQSPCSTPHNIYTKLLECCSFSIREPSPYNSSYFYASVCLCTFVFSSFPHHPSEGDPWYQAEHSSDG